MIYCTRVCAFSEVVLVFFNSSSNKKLMNWIPIKGLNERAVSWSLPSITKPLRSLLAKYVQEALLRLQLYEP